jgi:hypothetical protein
MRCEVAAVPMTRDELLALPAAVDLRTAARALSIGRTRAFELARRGEFPVPVLRVGVTYRVPTAPLLELLGLRVSVHHGPGQTNQR